jgi:hypothetical protein
MAKHQLKTSTITNDIEDEDFWQVEDDLEILQDYQLKNTPTELRLAYGLYKPEIY